MSGSPERASKILLKTSARRSIAEAAERRASVAELGEQIAPRIARPDNPQHRFYEKTVVPAAPFRISRLAKAVGLNQCPLGVCQHKAFHTNLES